MISQDRVCSAICPSFCGPVFPRTHFGKTGCGLSSGFSGEETEAQGIHDWPKVPESVTIHCDCARLSPSILSFSPPGKSLRGTPCLIPFTGEEDEVLRQEPRLSLHLRNTSPRETGFPDRVNENLGCQRGHLRDVPAALSATEGRMAGVRKPGSQACLCWS